MWKKGQGLSREHCDKISESLSGYKQTPEHIRKKNESRKGFKQSEHQKQKARKLGIKSWMITAPNGDMTIISNLKEFVAKNQPNMNVGVFYNFARTNSTWRGFRIKRLG